jgi:hypothetical protein
MRGNNDGRFLVGYPVRHKLQGLDPSLFYRGRHEHWKCDGNFVAISKGRRETLYPPSPGLAGSIRGNLRESVENFASAWVYAVSRSPVAPKHLRFSTPARIASFREVTISLRETRHSLSSAVSPAAVRFSDSRRDAGLTLTAAAEPLGQI